jgi:hypothetical protein
MKQYLYKMLKTEAEAEKAKALLSLELLGIMQQGLETIVQEIFIKMLLNPLVC